MKISNVTKDFSFSKTINSGLWNLNLILNKGFESDDFSISDIIEIYVFGSDYVDWKLIYKWVVDEVKKTFTDSWESLELSCLGLISLLNYLYYENNWKYKFSRNNSLRLNIQNILSKINSKYNFFTFEDDEILDEEFNIEFDSSTIFNALLKLSEVTWYSFYISEDWCIKFFGQNPPKNHFLKVWNSVTSIIQEEDSSNLYNSYYLEFETWEYEESRDESILKYGFRMQKENDTSIKDLSTAKKRVRSFLDQNMNPKLITILDLNDNYKIEEINPWDYVSILNFKKEIVNKKIVKVDYKISKAKVYLEDYKNIWKEIFSK